MTGPAMLGLVKSCIGTKFTSQFGDLIAVSILCILMVYTNGILLTSVLVISFIWTVKFLNTLIWDAELSKFIGCF
jgi:hypothetical protein